MSATFAAEFHARSAFSFLRGASQPEEMVARAAAIGYEAIAITDDLGFYGSARAHRTANNDDKPLNIQVTVGTSLQLACGSWLPVICTSQAGYQTLSQHLTDHHLADPHERIFNGLIALTGDREGPLCQPLLRNDKSAALVAAQNLINLFGKENLYVELNRHGLRDDGFLNRQLIDLAHHLRLPLIACNAPLHATPNDRPLADAFTCLRHHTTLDQAGKLLHANGERYLKSAAAMSRLFADIPEALFNTHKLKDSINYTLKDLGYHFPDFPDENGKAMSMPDQTNLLRKLCLAGAKRNNRANSKFLKQIKHEIALIDKLKFSGYFLIVQDIVWFARNLGIFCQGRGSASRHRRPGVSGR